MRPLCQEHFSNILFVANWRRGQWSPSRGTLRRLSAAGLLDPKGLDPSILRRKVARAARHLGDLKRSTEELEQCRALLASQAFKERFAQLVEEEARHLSSGADCGARK